MHDYAADPRIGRARYNLDKLFPTQAGQVETIPANRVTRRGASAAVLALSVQQCSVVQHVCKHATVLQAKAVLVLIQSGVNAVLGPWQAVDFVQ